MATRKLTDKTVQAAKAEDGARLELWDKLVPGLGLRVSGRTGRKVWVVRYRANGRHRKMKLGTYPGLSLADARDKARDAQVAAAAGDDPAHQRQERSSSTFEAMAREVLDAKKATTRESTQTERERILEAELLPEWRNVPAAAITRREVVQLVERIADRAPTMANRTLALIKTLYNEALRRGFPTVEANPAHMARPPGREEGRGRFLDRREMRAVWAATEAERPIMRTIFQLTLLTAQRIGSVCAMRWSDIDGTDVWTIPADQFKGRRAHAVPLSAAAHGVLDDLGRFKAEDQVFPSSRTDATRPYITGYNGAMRRIRDRTSIPRWTVHDFRRTFRTWATRTAAPDDPRDPAGLGVPPHVADAVLGHKEASLGFDRYTGDRARYLVAEKRDALERWGRFVT